MFSNWSGAKKENVALLNKTEVAIDNIKPWKDLSQLWYKD